MSAIQKSVNGLNGAKNIARPEWRHWQPSNQLQLLAKFLQKSPVNVMPCSFLFNTTVLFLICHFSIQLHVSATID